MKNIFKKLKKYLSGRINITITPSIEYKMRTFSARRISLLIILLIIIIAITTLGYLYKHYEENYRVLNQEVQELKRYREEKKYIQEELYSMVDDLNEMDQALKELNEFNMELKRILNDEIEIDDIDFNNTYDYEDGREYDIRLLDYQNKKSDGEDPVGGINHLLYLGPSEFVENINKEITRLKTEIPLNRENVENIYDSVKDYKNEKAATPSIWPVKDDGEGFISSDFGWRNHPISGERQFHEGLDIGVWYNTPVLATADGKISFVGTRGGYGRTIDIDHGFGYKTRFAHLNSYNVSKGDKVERGDIIGYSGNTGISTGPHLHYEVRLNNIPKNPRDYIGGGD